MPTFSSPGRNWPRWMACRARAEKAMLAAGWVRGSRKFAQVHNRRTEQLYRGTR